VSSVRTVTIEIPEKQVYALRAKALMAGLSLEAWFQKMVDQEVEPEPQLGPYKTGHGMLAKYGPAPSAEEIDENRRDMLRWAPKDI
jgi:hypothetical protein